MSYNQNLLFLGNQCTKRVLSALSLYRFRWQCIRSSDIQSFFAPGAAQIVIVDFHFEQLRSESTVEGVLQLVKCKEDGEFSPDLEGLFGLLDPIEEQLLPTATAPATAPKLTPKTWSLPTQSPSGMSLQMAEVDGLEEPEWVVSKVAPDAPVNVREDLD